MGRMLSARALQPSAANPSLRPPAESKTAALPAPIAREKDPREAPALRVAFYCGLAFLFLRLGQVPEILFSLTKTSTPVLYVAAVPAFLGALFAGSLARTLRSAAARLWLLFFVWMIVAAPFSSWVSGSITRVLFYGRDELPLLFIVGGLAVSWKDVSTVFYTFAGAGIFNLITAQLFAKISDGRLSLSEMTLSLGNPNDLASQLLLVLPFVLFIVLQKRNIVIRVLLLGVIGYGVYVALGTASRGGLIAMAVQLAVLLYFASPKIRIVALTATLGMGLAIPYLLPGDTVDRLSTVFGNSSLEAEESAMDRSYLFQQSVRYTVEHPLFGVGPDQFLNYEGKESQSHGWHGIWHATHCAYTQVSSECGLPGLIFFVAGLVSAVAIVVRLFQTARRQGSTDIVTACFCYLVGMAGYLGAIAFLSDAYSFHLPAMIGLAISMSSAGRREIAKRSGRTASPPLVSSQLRANTTLAVS